MPCHILGNVKATYSKINCSNLSSMANHARDFIFDDDKLHFNKTLEVKLRYLPWKGEVDVKRNMY